MRGVCNQGRGRAHLCPPAPIPRRPVQEDTRQHAPGVRDPAGGGAPSAPPAWSPTACCPRRLRPPPSAGSAQNSYKSWRRAAHPCTENHSTSTENHSERAGEGARARGVQPPHRARARAQLTGFGRRCIAVSLIKAVHFDASGMVRPRARAPPRTPFIPRARAPRAPFILPKPSSFLQSCSISGILLKPSRSAGSHRARAHAHTRSGRKDKNPNGSSNADGRCLSHWGQVLI